MGKSYQYEPGSEVKGVGWGVYGGKSLHSIRAGVTGGSQEEAGVKGASCKGSDNSAVFVWQAFRVVEAVMVGSLW